jgi:hypothetical protein
MTKREKEELIRQLRKMRDELQALMDKHASRYEYEVFAIKTLPSLEVALVTLST